MAKQPDKGSRHAFAKAPQFFKIILSSEPRLRLPREFVKRYGHTVPYLVSLEAPRGPIFQVELSRSNGEIWFDKGFQEFTDYYSIRFGHLLIFTYTEDFNFHVAIFDKSATEIEYPYTATKQKHGMFEKSSAIKEERQIDSDGSVEILASIPTRQKGKRSEQNAAKVPAEALNVGLRKHNSKRKRSATNDDVSIEISSGSKLCNATMRKQDIPSHKMKASIQRNSQRTRKPDVLSGKVKDGIQNNRVKDQGTTTNPSRPCSKQAIKKKWKTYTRRHLQHPFSGSAQNRRAKEGNVAYQKAKAFKSKNPSFVSFMRPSYVDRPFVLSITKPFARDYLTCKKHSEVVLCDSRGRTWKEKLFVGDLNAKLYWKNFVRDNDIEVGDACVFECLKNTKRATLNVIMFKNN